MELRELSRVVALSPFTTEAIAMPFLSCNRVSGGEVMIATSAKS